MIEYRESADGLEPSQLEGFFEGWPSPPPAAALREILRRSLRVVVAVDPADDRVVGFVNAVGDDYLAAYIPLLEVRPEYRGRGIGSELVRRLLARLDHLYMVDLVCDEELAPFYERLGFGRVAGMVVRNRRALPGSGPGSPPESPPGA